MSGERERSSLHAICFFLGQTVGPIAFGYGILQFGKVPTLLASAAVMLVLGIVCARLLRHTHATAARPKSG